MQVFKTKTFFLFALFSMLMLTAMAQKTISVTGTINNDKGVPLEGASIVIKSTTKGTMTDSKGSFQLFVPENAVLLISLIGYEAIQVKAKSDLKIVLNGTDRILSDVVVIGYGTQKKKRINRFHFYGLVKRFSKRCDHNTRTTDPRARLQAYP